MPGGSMFQPTPDAKSLTELLMEAEGLVAQTFPRALAVGATILVTNGTNGTVFLTAMPIRAGTVVTNLSISISTAATTMTLGKLGLYTIGGTLLASTASQTTAWESTGIKTVALTAPYTIQAADLTSGCVYAAVLAIASTAPTLYRGASGGSPITTAIGSGIKPWSNVATQTDLAASITPSTTGTSPFWIGAS